MKKLEYKKISDLILDIDNPRFGELYTGSNKEDDLIEYLLFNESAQSLAERLSTTKEFYIDKPLLVLQDGNKNIVKDGNRRCAAVKALLNPGKYGINLPTYDFIELPVVIYTEKEDIENRIMEEHTNSMFREWDRIAKAIEVFRQFKTGSSIESMEEIDSKPADLIKLASFYYEAVKVGGDDLKKLLRKGRGGAGGKTIIFERLFKYSNNHGYSFKKKPEYIIKIDDQIKFTRYIESIVSYLNANPSTTHRDVDDKKLEMFTAIGLSTSVTLHTKEKDTLTLSNTPSNMTKINGSKHKNKYQTSPQYNRIIPGSLKKVIDECYSLDKLNFTNSKIAMTRVTFECCLKYILEETDYNNKKLKDSAYFLKSFPPSSGKYTNFKELKKLFEDIILNSGKKQLFKQFELEGMHQIIHNYNIAGLVKDSETFCNNLIPMIEFMLESEDNLLNSIDTSKL